MLQLEYRKFSGLLILFAFLFPTFPAITRTGGAGRLGDMMMVVGVLSIILIYFFVFNRRMNTKNVAFSILFAGIFFLLISLSIIFEVQYISVRDIYEFHKPIYIILIFTFFLSFDWTTENFNQYFVKPFIFLFVFFTCYGLIEAFTGPIGQFISSALYKNPRAILVGKSTGSFGVTYFFGTFMLFASFFFFFRYVLRKKKMDLLWFLGATMVVIATQSRTIFIAFGFGLLYIFLTYWRFKGFPFKKVLYFGTFFLVALIAILWTPIMNWVASSFPYLYYGIDFLIRSGGVDASGVGSANVRYQQLLWAWDNQFAYPLIGAGIGKATGPQLESFYALYLFRYGFIGIAISIGILLLNFIMSLKCYAISKRYDEKSTSAFFLAFSIFCVVLPICSLSSVMTDQPRLAILYYGATAAMIGYHRVMKNEAK